MTAAIVTIGDEILIGQIVDTNSGFIAKALDSVGIQTCEMLSISDNKKHILKTFLSLQNKVDFVFITGGLGPTKDDITKHTFCEYFDDSLVENEEVLAHVKSIIEGVYKRPITLMNRDQALVPSKCEVLFNAMGTAPGMWMRKEQTVYVSLPGVPYEMKYLVENVILPKIVAEFKRPYIVHKTILTYGQGESVIAERIESWENNLPDFIKLAYLPSLGKVRLRLSARGENEDLLLSSIHENIQSLNLLIGDIIVGFDEGETIEFAVGQLLAQNNNTIATAESCSGGKIAQMISSVPGASSYFRGSVVCYATDTKISILGVDEALIQKHGVVSEVVAREMAVGIKKLMNSDYAIATTGNAGPSVGDLNADLGAVFIAIATPERVFVEAFNFGQPREKVISKTANKALELIRFEILKMKK